MRGGCQGFLCASLIAKVGNWVCFFRKHGQTEHVRRHGSHRIVGCSYTAAQTTDESHWSNPGKLDSPSSYTCNMGWLGGVGGSVKPRGSGCRSPHLERGGRRETLEGGRLPLALEAATQWTAFPWTRHWSKRIISPTQWQGER